MNRTLQRRAPLALLAVAVLLTVFGSWLFAQGNEKAKSGTVETPDSVSVRKEGDIYVTVYTNAVMTQEDSVFSAKKVEQRTQKGSHVFTCTGNPVYKSPENTILSEKVVANTSPRSAEFTGNVNATRISSKEGQGGKLLGNSTTVVTSQKLNYDYGRKWAEFTGGEVVMVNTPAETKKIGDAKSDIAGEPSRVTCDKLSYDFANKRALAVGSAGRQVHIIQKEKGRDIWADQAVYDEKTNLVTLTGHVLMKNTGDGEVKRIENVGTATISLDEENDFIDLIPIPGMKIKSFFEVPEDDNANDGKKR